MRGHAYVDAQLTIECHSVLKVLKFRRKFDVIQMHTVLCL